MPGFIEQQIERAKAELANAVQIVVSKNDEVLDYAGWMNVHPGGVLEIADLYVDDSGDITQKPFTARLYAPGTWTHAGYVGA